MNKVHWRKIQSLLLSPCVENKTQGDFLDVSCFPVFKLSRDNGHVLLNTSIPTWSTSSTNGNFHRCFNKLISIDILKNKTNTGSIQYLYEYSPSSTTSPMKTLEIPDIAITTFWDTEVPVMDWISLKEDKDSVINTVKDWLILPIWVSFFLKKCLTKAECWNWDY